MIRKLASYIGEFKKNSIITPIFMILECICEVIIPLLMAMIIDNGLNNSDMGYVAKIGIVMLIIAMLSLTCGALGAKYAANASAGYARNLRSAMFENIQDFSFENIDKYSTAGLVTRLTTDITNVQNAYQMILRMLVRAPIMLISAMIMSIVINPALSLVFLVAIIFLGVILFSIIKVVFPRFTSVFKKYDALNASVQENLIGIRTVKSAVREDFEINKFKEASGNVRDQFIFAEKLIVLNAPVMQFTMYTCILVLSWLGANMIVSNTMTTGQLMSFFTYAVQILMSLMMISMVFVMITLAKSSAERILEVLDEETTIKNSKNPIKEVKDGSIVFENVDFSYAGEEDKLNLENVNLEIKSGETIGIIGGTGSAKSTLVQLIPRLYDVTSGSIKVGGVDVRDYDIDTLRNEVSMVLQKNVLFSGTIKENLRWGDKNATDEELIDACKKSCADEFIQTFPEGYNTYIEQGGTNVSGGQKQRLCIARALLKKPKILILDDSTSAVDTKTDATIRAALQNDISSTTKIIIAQRISSIESSDKIIVLDDGKINAIGTHDELKVNNAIYRDVYESQVKGADDNE
ncbi:ABC transporter ATP-binding protein [Intestinibacter sp.]